eukprot:COSAG05_NODE_14796_length_387_cov_0.538194_1_plen_45_part_10
MGVVDVMCVGAMGVVVAKLLYGAVIAAATAPPSLAPCPSAPEGAP